LGGRFVLSFEGFQFRKVTSAEDLCEVFRLRYKSYCEEWGFEKPEDHPGGLEYDEYDKHSAHFICTRNISPVGTIRLIFNSEKGFPTEKHCTFDEKLFFMDRDKVSEISRLAISKEYLRRAEDRFMYLGEGGSVADFKKGIPERRKRQEIVCGLYKCIYRESKKKGITHWYAVMGKGLYALLRRLGIVFKPIGPEINYHGPRRPYLGCIADIEREVSACNPELYKDFVDDLALKSF
jgi:N-acyl amino acid synthase of PEP-CTERM/exosortase system